MIEEQGEHGATGIRLETQDAQENARRQTPALRTCESAHALWGEHQRERALITWRIDHDQRLVRATGSDVVTMADLTRYLAEVAAAGGMPHGKFIDARFTTLELNASDVRDLSEAVKHYAMQGPLGPIAILVDVEMTELAAELFQQKTADRSRPLGIFRTEEEALAWLAERR